MGNENKDSFPFFAAKYLADVHVEMMSAEEEGCYIRLLAYCWREKGLPNDPERLQRLCKGIKPSQLVMDRFTLNGSGKLQNKMLTKLQEKRDVWREKSREGGRKSAVKRWGKKKKVQLTTPIRVVTPPLQGWLQNIDKKLDNEPFCHMPCKGPRDTYPVTKEFIEEMKELYPGVDIERETKRAKAWLISNPKKGKTYQGMSKYLNSWYARKQDNPGRSPAPGGGSGNLFDIMREELSASGTEDGD